MVVNFDMSNHTLYFSDVLAAIVKKFDVKQVSRAKIVFRSLKDLKEFPINIDTSTIYVFDNREYLEIDMKDIKVSGYSSINFNTTPVVYDHYRNKVSDTTYFTSLMNNGDELFRIIIGNSSLKKIDFYTPKAINLSDRQKQISLKVPETLEYSK